MIFSAKEPRWFCRRSEQRIEKGDREIPVEVDGNRVITLLEVSDRQRKHLVAGGTLNYVKKELGSA